MKKLRNLYIFTAISISAFSLLFCVWILNGPKTSYAIETGTFSNGFPTTTFNSNLDSASIENYINTAFGSDNSYANYMGNFNVNANYYDSNNTNPLYILMKNLEVPKATESFELTTDSVHDINDKAITYIINHGFNNTNSVNTVFTEKHYEGEIDNKIKQYITQIALWLYIYENKTNYTSNYCKNSGNGYTACDFLDNTNNVLDATTVRTIINKASEKDNYEYLKYIIDLVDNAKKYQGGTEPAIGSFDSNFNYSFTSDNSMIYIYNLLPTITGGIENYMYYAVEIEDPNNYGVYIADKNDNKITNTNQMKESFSVVIPLGDDITKIDLSSITIKVYAYFVVDSNKSYVVTTSTGTALPGCNSNLVVKYGDNKYDRYSDVTLGYSPYQIISTQFKLSNFTKISKIDVTNSNELPGATLVVTSKSDSTKKWTWVSTNKPHLIFLEDGDYSLCETIAPSGYEQQTECIDFTVDSGKINTVKMENKPVLIPNTSSMVNKFVLGFGLVLILTGGGIVAYFTIYKRRNAIKEV